MMIKKIKKSELLAKPVIAAIIEKQENGKLYILMQTRWKPKVSPKYTGLYEIPAGGIREYEDVFETVKREVQEETGLIVKHIKTEGISNKYTYHDDEGYAFRPFCCVQMSKGAPFIGFVFIVNASGEPKAQLEEVRDPKWIEISELKQLFEAHPERFFTLEAGALELYFKSKMK